MTDLEEIIAEINRIDGCGVTKSRVVAVLRSQVGKRVYFAKGVLTLPQQIALAADLLKSMPRNAARDSLMIRLRVSRAVAYELIRRALNAPQQEALL
jgi:hypothetical protein